MICYNCITLFFLKVSKLFTTLSPKKVLPFSSVGSYMVISAPLALDAFHYTLNCGFAKVITALFHIPTVDTY